MDEELQPLATQEAQLESAPHPPQPGFGAVPMLRDVAVSVILAIVMIVFVYQPVKVEGTSMMPGLTDQERIFINKYTYKLGSGKIERLDPIVFYYPYDVTQSYIKRVIGLPGDTIQIDEGTVYLNGNRIKEPYVPAEYKDHRSVAKEVVPPGMYFVMGDHRSSSNDSRIWGFVPRKEIYGKAVFIYWPPNKIGRVR
jgi:signal peptidase I